MSFESVTKYIPEQTWLTGMKYDDYVKLLGDLFEQGKTTGDLQTADRLEHSRINLTRMKRIYEKYSPQKNLVEEIKQISEDVRFLFIVEGWCGDAAQVVPAIEKILQKSERDTRYILRDENPEIMAPSGELSAIRHR